MKHIFNCTLVCIDCFNYGGAITAIKKSLEQNVYDKVLFLTDNSSLQIEGVETVLIAPIQSKLDYSKFVMKELHRYIQTDFALIIQHDGYVLNGDLFDDRLYDIDYCGAMWLESDGLNCGNGGFSWRSKELLEIIATDDHINSFDPEDVQICRVYRNYLETKYGLKWATEEIAEQFSFELREPFQPTFGFHGYFHEPYKPTVILKRSGAMGDIILMEPIMRHFVLQGFRVVLDIPERYFELFSQHVFHVEHLSKFDKRRIPAKHINLDLAYESQPGKSLMQSYFEISGIENYKLTRPQIYPKILPQSKLFTKYAVVHLDYRPTKERNVYGVDWHKVESYLNELGYFVLQVGNNNFYQCGQLVNTSTLPMLKFVIAGCDLFIGVDSGPSHIAVAHNKPSVLLFGATDPHKVHVDFTGIEIVQNACDYAGCWHSTTGGTSGVLCHYLGTQQYLQCANTDSDKVISAINRLHGINSNTNDI